VTATPSGQPVPPSLSQPPPQPATPTVRQTAHRRTRLPQHHTSRAGLLPGPRPAPGLVPGPRPAPACSRTTSHAGPAARTVSRAGLLPGPPRPAPAFCQDHHVPRRPAARTTSYATPPPPARPAGHRRLGSRPAYPVHHFDQDLQFWWEGAADCTFPPKLGIFTAVPPPERPRPGSRPRNDQAWLRRYPLDVHTD
jgi:hypothetical protein